MPLVVGCDHSSRVEYVSAPDWQVVWRRVVEHHKLTRLEVAEGTAISQREAQGICDRSVEPYVRACRVRYGDRPVDSLALSSACLVRSLGDRNGWVDNIYPDLGGSESQLMPLVVGCDHSSRVEYVSAPDWQVVWRRVVEHHKLTRLEVAEGTAISQREAQGICDRSVEPYVRACRVRYGDRPVDSLALSSACLVRSLGDRNGWVDNIYPDLGGSESQLMPLVVGCDHSSRVEYVSAPDWQVVWRRVVEHHKLTRLEVAEGTAISQREAQGICDRSVEPYVRACRVRYGDRPVDSLALSSACLVRSLGDRNGWVDNIYPDLGGSESQLMPLVVGCDHSSRVEYVSAPDWQVVWRRVVEHHKLTRLEVAEGTAISQREAQGICDRSVEPYVRACRVRYGDRPVDSLALSSACLVRSLGDRNGWVDNIYPDLGGSESQLMPLVVGCDHSSRVEYVSAPDWQVVWRRVVEHHKLTRLEVAEGTAISQREAQGICDRSV